MKNTLQTIKELNTLEILDGDKCRINQLYRRLENRLEEIKEELGEEQ
jgi:hypothetical protein